MTDIVPIPAAPTVPTYPALGSTNFNQEAYTYGTSMPGVSFRIWEIGKASETNATAASERAEASALSAGQSQGFRNEAEGFRNTANTAAGTATTQAGIATGAAGTATTQAGLANTARSGAETARSGSESARDDSVLAKNASESARDAAQGYRDQAEVFATQQLKGSSTTSVTPGAGAKSFVIEANRSFVTGMYVVATSTSDPNTRMSGYVTSYNMGSGALSLSVDAFTGSTAKADWVIGVAAPGGSTSSVLVYVPVAGTTQAAAPGARYGLQNAAKTTVTLQASPVNGDVVAVICDNLRRDNVIARNGQLIMGLAEDLIIDNPYFPIMLQYQSPFGWRFIS
ncbi:hypothetical protein [Delftia lacustris]|uniref:Uncharacterized protein n=1 Tax=Delftia lacustris TaxID=558537 RepID=A0A1H3TFR6_9BURK|nr:hypothetical protein [Delftia lacustris]SDZ49122.1 hypothetical protein SAMN05421547_12845 [Delftia lacustris]